MLGCTCVHKRSEVIYKSQPSGTFRLLFETESFIGLGLSHSGQVSCLVSFSSLGFIYGSAEVVCVLLQPAFIPEFWVFKLRTSQLGTKCFSNWATASAPEQFFLSIRGPLKTHEPNHLHPIMPLSLNTMLTMLKDKARNTCQLLLCKFSQGQLFLVFRQQTVSM